MIKYPQVLINVKTNAKVDLDNHSKLNEMLKVVEAELGGDGRVLIRASGTEPLIRVMVEASNLNLAETSANKLAEALG